MTVRRSCGHLAALIVALSSTVALADDRFWVGYQNGCMIDYPEEGAYTHGDNWYGYVPAGPSDVAIFGSGFDPQENGVQPHNIHFGDFCLNWDFCSLDTFDADSVVIGGLTILGDDWTFDMGSGVAGFCDPLPSSRGACTVTGVTHIGVSDGPASLLVRNGSVYCDTVAVGADGATGELRLSGGATATVGDVFLVGAGNSPARGNVIVGPGCSLTRLGVFNTVDIGIGSGNRGTLQVIGGSAHLGNEAVRFGHFGDGLGFVSAGGSLVIGSKLELGGHGLGQVAVIGTGSELSVATYLDLGVGDGAGALTMDRGSASCLALAMGVDAESQGYLAIGDGASVSVTDVLVVGVRGAADAQVFGEDSALQVGWVLFVGQAEGAVGALSVVDGSASAVALEVGSQALSTGTVDIGAGDGDTAVVDIEGAVLVGDRGTGTVGVHGGTLTADHLRVGIQPGANGTVEIDGASGLVQLDSFMAVGESGTGLVRVSNGGQLIVPQTIGLGGLGSGVLELAGDGISGIEVVATSVELLPGGRIQGSGVIQGDLVASGGTVSPGTPDSPVGTIGVLGNVDFGLNAIGVGPAELDVAGPTPGKDHDKIKTSGNARLGGNLVINLAEGYVPAIGDTFAVLEYGSSSAARGTDGDFDCFIGLDLGDSLSLAPIAQETQYLLVAGPPSGNHVPIANPDSTEVLSSLPVTMDLVANDGDADGDGLRIYDLDTSGTVGSVVVSSDFTVEYTPDPMFVGVDTFSYRLTDCLGGAASATVVVEANPVAGVGPAGSEIAAPTGYLQVQPTPFDATTSVAWTLPTPGDTDVAVYDVEGRRVRTLQRGRQAAGTHSVVWAGQDDGGSRLAAGVYFVRMHSDAVSDVRRVVLLAR